MLSQDIIENLDRQRLQPEMLPEGRLNIYALACCLSEALQRGIVPSSVAAFQQVLEEDEAFVDDLNSLYPDDAHAKEVGLGLDTAERHVLLEILAMRFADRSWPILMDSEKSTTDFLLKMEEALKEKGWDFRFDWEGLGYQRPQP